MMWYYDHSMLDPFQALLATFSHANVFHLFANVFALWSFKPRTGTLASGLVIGWLAMMLPSPWNPVCGLSGVVFACYGRKAVWDGKLHGLTLAVNTVFLLFGNVDVALHMYSYVGSWLFWKYKSQIIFKIKSYGRKKEK